MSYEILLTDVVDIAFMMFLIYTILLWFKRSRAAFVLTGMLLFGAIFLAAKQFNMFLTAHILQGFFAVFLFALVVIFQEEIRHFFEQVAKWGISPRLRMRGALKISRDEVEALVRTLHDLAREKIGALIVIQGRSTLTGHLQNGIDLNGRVGDAILKSIFDPNSAGHDGAVIVEGNQIMQFAAHLPLSKNFRKLEQRGTRHAAALGLSELSDAMCLIVSEEKGVISIARHGDIKIVTDSETLAGIIDHFYDEIYPRKERQSIKSFFLRNYREKIFAFFLTIILWFVFVFGSEVVYKSFSIPVEFAELPSGISISDVDPNEIELTFSGPRRNIYFLRRDNLRMHLKSLNLRKGPQIIRIFGTDMSFPKNVTLDSIYPSRVKINVREGDEAPVHESEESMDPDMERMPRP